MADSAEVMALPADLVKKAARGIAASNCFDLDEVGPTLQSLFLADARLALEACGVPALLAEVERFNGRQPVLLGEPAFQFSSFDHWVAKAQSWFSAHELTASEVVCLDAQDRACLSGADFMRAEREEAFPVKVYALRVSTPHPGGG